MIMMLQVCWVASWLSLLSLNGGCCRRLKSNVEILGRRKSAKGDEGNAVNNSRRQLLWTSLAAVVGSSSWQLPCWAAGTVEVTLDTPKDRLGLELFETQIGNPPRPVVAIRNNNNKGRGRGRLQAGMILDEYSSVNDLKARLEKGPYPVRLRFDNLAAGGDALADTGAPLVTARDALRLAQQQSQTTTDTSASTSSASPLGLQIEVLNDDQKPSSCQIQSRRNDVLEINYTAASFGNNGQQQIVYDSSERRGTGQPYQMVLGSGDMLTGVDLGLYDMCPGERRRLTIPPRLAYGSKGNRLFGIPPDQTLVWQVELVRINGVVDENDSRSRDEMEERVPYTNPR